MAARKPLIAGNWKMFGRRADLAEIPALGREIGPAGRKIDVLVCPPTPYIASAAEAAREAGVLIGAQDCCAIGEDSARTGEASAAMLADVGARYVIVGHSERRSFYGETSVLVRQKAEAVLRAGLTPIVCVGETMEEREAGRIAEIVGGQTRQSVPGEGGAVVVAYEPVWAIGGNRTPTPAEIAEVHALIRGVLGELRGQEGREARILYGGSVNPKNAAELLGAEGVDGALVGRASLRAADFAAIIRAHPDAS